MGDPKGVAMHTEDTTRAVDTHVERYTHVLENEM